MAKNTDKLTRELEQELKELYLIAAPYGATEQGYQRWRRELEQKRRLPGIKRRGVWHR